MKKCLVDVAKLQNATGIYGDATRLCGDVTGLRGDATEDVGICYYDPFTGIEQSPR